MCIFRLCECWNTQHFTYNVSYRAKLFWLAHENENVNIENNITEIRECSSKYIDFILKCDD